MTDTIIATRATITIGSLTVDGFMLPDGSYRMSQTQVAECIKDDRIYARRFLSSKAITSLTGKGYTPDTFEIDPSEQVRGQTRFQGGRLILSTHSGFIAATKVTRMHILLWR